MNFTCQYFVTFQKIFLSFLLFSFLFYSPNSFSQSEEGIRLNSYGLYSQVEKSLSDQLPTLKQLCENILQDLNKKGTLPELLQSMDQQITQLNAILTEQVRGDPNFDQIEKSIDQIRISINQAKTGLNRKNISQARTNLKKVVIYTKILLESPLLKMTQAEIDLDQATQRIGRQDYIAAGLFLDRAADLLQDIQIQGNEKLNKQLSQIKSELAVAHQQALLGKYKDELAGRSIWKRMQQAQVDSMSHYYDMWSNTYNPQEP